MRELGKSHKSTSTKFCGNTEEELRKFKQISAESSASKQKADITLTS
jgi:hypothetical protein